MNTDTSIPVEYVQQKAKFRIDSNDKVDFSVLGDNGGGLQIKSDGRLHIYTDKNSEEVVGKSIPFKENIPAKMIRAENGNIVLDAEKGNIILKGHNIIIEANDALGGQVIIKSNKIIQLSSPNVKAQGDYITMAGTGSVSLSGSFTEVTSQIGTEVSASTDVIKASFFGKILSGLKKFTEFFTSICG